MDNVVSLQLARERAPRGGSNEHAFKRLGLPLWNSGATGLDARSASAQGLLERLEAENAQLRATVVELVLQIRALRDRAGTLTV
jgi:cell division protein FtsB